MASPYPKDFQSDYNKVLKYPKDASITLPAGDKKFVWVPYDSELGYIKAEVLKEDANKRTVKLDSGEVKTYSKFNPSFSVQKLITSFSFCFTLYRKKSLISKIQMI